MSDKETLIEDLLGIYTTTGREVSYVADSGERRAYWPNRYLQALRRAIDEDQVIEFVERTVTRDDSTRGFGHLQEAGRLDLTIEALVADTARPYHHLFSQEAVICSTAHLMEASEIWQLETNLADLRMQRDRLDNEIRRGEELLAFAEAHGHDSLGEARASIGS